MSVTTYQEVLDHLIDRFEINQHTGRPRRLAQRAIEVAYRKLAECHDWSFYHREALINVLAPQTDGTIAYTASTRRVTLSGATWPDDVILWRLIIDDKPYQISKRISGTVIELDENSYITENISAGATYSIQKDRYLLPCGFRTAISLRHSDDDYEIAFTDLDGQNWVNTTSTSASDPFIAAIAGSEDYYNRLMLFIGPVPATDTQLRLIYKSAGRPLGINSLSNEENSVTATRVSDSVIDCGVTLPDTVVGSVIWFSSDAYTPTGKLGSSLVRNAKAGDYYFPYTYERFITAVSGQNITLGEDLTVNVTGKGYLITDPIDIHDDSMRVLFMKMAELEYAEMADLQKILADLRPVVRMELSKARESQVRTPVGLSWRSDDQISRKGAYVDP